MDITNVPDITTREGLYHAFDMLSPGKDVSKEAVSRFENAFRYAQQHYFKPNND